MCGSGRGKIKQNAKDGKTDSKPNPPGKARAFPRRRGRGADVVCGTGRGHEKNHDARARRNNGAPFQKERRAVAEFIRLLPVRSAAYACDLRAGI